MHAYHQCVESCVVYNYSFGFRSVSATKPVLLQTIFEVNSTSKTSAKKVMKTKRYFDNNTAQSTTYGKVSVRTYARKAFSLLMLQLRTVPYDDKLF